MALELDALVNSDKVFLIESLLLWIHHYRLNQGNREDFKHCIVVEEEDRETSCCPLGSE